MRSDFLTGFLESGFAELVRESTIVGALARDAPYEVMEKPAEQAGLTFAPGVVARMVDDCGGGDALPLLAYTLHELYQCAGGSGGTVTEETDRALGGVAGALSERADQIAAELADAPVIPIHSRGSRRSASRTAVRNASRSSGPDKVSNSSSWSITSNAPRRLDRQPRQAHNGRDDTNLARDLLEQKGQFA